MSNHESNNEMYVSSCQNLLNSISSKMRLLFYYLICLHNYHDIPFPTKLWTGNKTAGLDIFYQLISNWWKDVNFVQWM